MTEQNFANRKHPDGQPSADKGACSLSDEVMILGDDERFMNLALAEARSAATDGEIPVGAVVVCRGRVVASAHNMTERLGDVTAHAEMLAITSAAATIGGKYLSDCTLYVTVEPCAMCAAAIGWAQVKRLVIGTDDPKRGYGVMYERSPLHPRCEVVSGILKEPCRRLMTDFFRARRK